MRLARASLILAASMLSVHCASPDAAPTATDTPNQAESPRTRAASIPSDITAITPQRLSRSATPRYLPLGRIEGYGNPKTGELWVRPITNDTSAAKGGRRVAVQTQALGATPGYLSLESLLLNDGIPNDNPSGTIELYTRGAATGNTPPSFTPSACLTHLQPSSTATSADFNAQGVGCAEQHIGNFTSLSFAHVYLDPDRFISGNPGHLPWPLPFTVGSANTPNTISGTRNPPDSALGLWDFGPLGARGSGSNLVNMWLFFKSADTTNFKWTGSLVGEVYEDCLNSGDDDADGVVNNGCGQFASGEPCFANADCTSNSCSASSIVSRFGRAGGDISDDTAGACLGGPTNLAYATGAAIYTKDAAITPNVPSNDGGAPTLYEVAPPLPAGLSLHATTGEISGTPTALAALGSYTVTASNAFGAGDAILTITVNDIPPSALTYATNPATYTRYTTITANVPSNAGGAVTEYSAPSLPAGLSLDPVTGIVSGLPAAVLPAADYIVTAANSGGTTTVPLTIAVNEAPPAGLGYQVSNAVYTKGAAITSNSPSSSGGPITAYTVSPDLPAGLNLSPTDGVISGAATVLAPAADYTITGSNAAGSTTVTVSITVNDIPPATLAYPYSPAVYTKGTAITNNVPVYTGGAPTAYSISQPLPTGLTLNTATGVISGMPSVLSTVTNYTITATNTGGAKSATVTVTVNDVAPTWLTYSQNPAVYTQGGTIPDNSPSSGGGAITGYSISPSVSSTGLTFDNVTGILSGSPTSTLATTGFTVTATNSGGSIATALTLTISTPGAAAYYQDVTITAGSTTPAGYQALISVGPGNILWTHRAYANGSDVRIADIYNTALPYWIELFDDVNDRALIWVKLPSALSAGASTTIRLRYGGSTNTVTTGSISSAMDFGDDFRLAAGLNNTTWDAGDNANVTQATAFAIAGTAPNAYLRATSSGTTNTGRIKSVAAFSDSTPFVVQSKATIVTASTDGIFVSGLDNAAAATTADGAGVLAARASSDDVRYGGTWDGTIAYHAESTPARFTVTNDGGASHYNTFKRENLANSVYTTAWTRPSAGNDVFAADSLRVTLGHRYDAGSGTSFDGQALDVRWDWVLVRKYVSTEPAVAVTNVENLDSDAPMNLTYSVNPATYFLGTPIANNTPAYGGGTPTVFSITPSLPAGLSLNTSTGVISGTPSALSATAMYTVTAANSDGPTAATLTITVTAVPPSALVYSANPATYLKGTAITPNTPSNAGGVPTSYSISPSLPSGLTLNTTTGVISGVPTVLASAANYTVTATNGGGSTTATLNLTVDPVYTVGARGTVGAGAYHTCAVVNGGAQCWGYNAYGQLGNNTTADSLAPVQVGGLNSGVQAVTASQKSSCAIASGGLRCWGYNGYGQLGDNTNTNSAVPVQVSGLTSGVQSVAMGDYHACAVVNGSVKCWGYNGYGGLGNGSTSNSSVPVQVTSVTSGATAVAVGTYSTCAIVNGAAKCWGYNSVGQLGDGSTTNRTTAVAVTGLTTGVQAIGLGAAHGCAVVNGNMRCWGYNSSGQLGNGSVTTSTTSVQVTGLTSGVQGMSVGGSHSCALVDGGARCWGLNGSGQLGNATWNDSLVPVAVSGLPSGVQELYGSSSAAGNCAMVNDAIKCWGVNSYGGLGDNSSTNRNVPVQAGALTAGTQTVVAGAYHSCAVVNGGARCWGYNGEGQLGDGTYAMQATPVQVTGLVSGVQAVAAGLYHTCALQNGGVKCWGSGSYGQLGDGSGSSIATPIQVWGLTSGVTAITAGFYHSCAIQNGAMKCWGDGYYGQIGDGYGSYAWTPSQVVGLTGGVQSIGAGYETTCAVVNGSAKCWGDGYYGQLGNGSYSQYYTPQQVAGLSSGAMEIAVGYQHACARVGGSAACWGDGGDGQLGNASYSMYSTPQAVYGLTGGVQGVAVGFYHSCAVVNGGAACWGDNIYGQLGNGSTANSVVPVASAGLGSGLTAIAAGVYHSNALVNGRVRSWGDNYYAQLGTGYSGSPALVSVPTLLSVGGATPPALSYPTNPAVYIVGAAIAANTPTNSGDAATAFGVMPTLPAGLALNPSTGAITGTPTVVAATAVYMVAATNDGGTTTTALTLTVNDLPPTSLAYATNPATYTINTPITINWPSNSGGAVTTYSVSPALPSGLTLMASGGYIIGTPTALQGATAYTVTATNSGGSTTASLTITVNNAPGNLTYTTTVPQYTLGTTIANNTPSNTGGAVVSYSISPALPAGLAFSTSTGVISGTPAALSPAASYVVTATNASGSSTRTLTITVKDVPPSALTYLVNPATYMNNTPITLNAPSSSGGPVVSYSISPALSAGLTFSTTTGILMGTPTVSAFAVSYTITATNSGGSTTVTLPITVSDLPPLVLTYSQNPAVYTKGAAIASNTPSVTGGACIAYSVSPALPTGLSLNASTGVISGTPTVLSTSATYTVTCSNPASSTNVGVTITVNDVPPSALTYSANPAVYTVGVPITANVPSHSGGPVVSYALVLCSLPAGLSLNTTTGVISGTPTAAVTKSCPVAATNSGGNTSVTINYTVTVVAPSALTYSKNPARYYVGQAIASNTPTHAGTPATSYSISPALPAGLSLSTSTGVLTGTPTAVSAPTDYTVTATNSAGSGNATVNLSVDVGRLIGMRGVVAAGGGHSCAVVEGGVRCWGKNSVGQLGNNSTTDSVSSVQVSGLTAGAQRVAAGDNHSCAVVNGGVWCWGDNNNGQLGDGTVTQSTVPVQVSGLTGVTGLSAGDSHTCALTNGAVKCWGDNSAGQLGNGTTTTSTIPVQVTGLTTGVQAVATGGDHSCAIVNGSARCWGNNNNGGLGNGTTTDSTTPVQVTGLTSGVQGIVAGGDHTCARADGSAKCWGLGAQGQLGNTGIADSSVPVQVTGLTSGVQDLLAGAEHSCAIVDGSAKCWGGNGKGQLGDGTTTNRNAPVQVSGLTSGLQALAAASLSEHTCALVNGGLRCWGNNNNGGLGDGTTTQRTAPVQVAGLSTGRQAIVAGYYASCAIVNGGAQCWGYNYQGQLGDGTTTTRSTPVQVVGLTSGVQDLAVIGYHVCAVVNGAAKCWGSNSYGQLGNNSTTASYVPVQVSGLTAGVQDVGGSGSGDGTHSCAVVNGAAKCWGDNWCGQLGNGSTTVSYVPVQVSGITSGVQDLGIGGASACAVVNGAVKCWGNDYSGQLGDGTGTNSTIPVATTGLGSGVQAIFMGYANACALTGGALKCWGYNPYGQVGNGVTSNALSPAQVSGLTTGVQLASVGYSHICAVVNGAAKCWGYNYYGQLGNSSTTSSTVPVQVSGLTTGVLALTSGYHHNLALTGSAAQGWGTNIYYQLGNGTTTTSLVPTATTVVP